MRTPYRDTCVCGHVRESHVDTGPWQQECRPRGGEPCGCNAFGSRLEMQDEVNEDE